MPCGCPSPDDELSEQHAAVCRVFADAHPEYAPKLQRIPLFKVRVSPAAEAAVGRVLASGYIGEGPVTQQFERALQDRYAHSYVRVLNSGSSALWLAYQLAGIGPGDKVAVTPLTCLATTELLVQRGAELVWLDVDPETGSVDVERKQLDIPSWKAIVLCNWGGDVGYIVQTADVATRFGIPLIEDAAHAFGNPDVGKHSDFAILSFQAIKLLTSGDGGALLCRHAPDAERARLLRWFCLDRTKSESMRCYQQVPEPGWKCQMNDITAAVGLANLEGVDDAVAAHQAHARLYDDYFFNTPVRPLTRHASSSCWLYSVRVKDARTFMAKMAARGIEASQVHARNDTQRIFHTFRTHLPGMDQLSRELACLPVGWWLSPEAIAFIAETALAVVQEEGWA